MRRGRAVTAIVGSILAVLLAGTGSGSGSGTGGLPAHEQAAAACLLTEIQPRRIAETEIRRDRILIEERRDVLDASVAPGSIAKIATLLAALETRTITADTAIACPRRTVVQGRTLTCSHPDVGRPLRPAEALAHSCNAFFASVASRLPRAALDAALVRLGLSPAEPGVPTALAALGLEGVRATPRQLLSSFTRLALDGTTRIDPSHRAVVIEGLRGAASYGTARAFGDAGITALAKTGTAARAGGFLGIVVAVLPADRPTHAIAVVAPGAAGMDAAAIAAERVQSALKAPAPGKPTQVPAVRIGRANGSGYDVVNLPLEDYVAAVVAAEAPPGAHAEALKAIAVAARTFAEAGRRRHEAEGFELCDLTHCQVLGRATGATTAAALATAGSILTYDGSPAQVYYTGDCGGHSERPSSAWPGSVDPPYLPARPEPGCRVGSPWSSTVTAAQVAAAMRASGARGDAVRSLRVVARTVSGRVSMLHLEGFDPPMIRGEAFRAALGRTAGWQLLKSTAFEVKRVAAGYRFEGWGRGHGVGLCLVGAARMAASGSTAAQILERYFPGIRLRSGDAGAKTGSGPTVEVTVPAGAEREGEMIRAMAGDASREIARAAGVPPPSAIVLVFHPTVEAYVRATGRPWWTSAVTRGTRVDLLPPDVLRRRRLLERTVRHEIAHVVVGGRLDGRPLWVQEGAAMFLAGELPEKLAPSPPRPRPYPSPGGKQSPTACPADEEMARSPSAEAMKNAYGRAAACFQQQLRTAKAWSDVGK